MGVQGKVKLLLFHISKNNATFEALFVTLNRDCACLFPAQGGQPCVITPVVIMFSLHATDKLLQ